MSKLYQHHQNYYDDAYQQCMKNENIPMITKQKKGKKGLPIATQIAIGVFIFTVTNLLISLTI